MTQMQDRIRFWWRRNDREADGRDSRCGNRLGCGSYQQQIGFAELLELLGHTDGEFTFVCHRSADCREFSSSVLESGNTSGYVEGLSDGCAWFSVNPTGGPQHQRWGRAAVCDVTRWAAMCVDINDVAFDDWDQVRSFIGSLSGKVRQYPSALILSGHGVQLLWVIEDGQLDTAEKVEHAYWLSRRFGRLAAKVARLEFGKRLDAVSDLSQVLWVPGTRTFTDPDKPRLVVAVCGVGGPLAVDRIEECLDEWAPEIAFDDPRSGGFHGQA